MAASLEQIVIALVALTEIGKSEIIQIANDLRLKSILTSWIDDWFSAQVKVQRQLDVK